MKTQNVVSLSTFMTSTTEECCCMTIFCPVYSSKFTQKIFEVKFYTHYYILIGVIHIHHFFGTAKRIKYALSKSLCNVTDVNVELENGNLCDVD